MAGYGKLDEEFIRRGHPKRGGRVKGTKNTKTVIREVLLGKSETLELLAKGSAELGLRPRHERVSDLLKTGSGQVKAIMEKFLFEQEHGKAKETVTLDVGFSSAVEAAFARARSKK